MPMQRARAGTPRCMPQRKQRQRRQASCREACQERTATAACRKQDGAGALPRATRCLPDWRRGLAWASQSVASNAGHLAWPCQGSVKGPLRASDAHRVLTCCRQASSPSLADQRACSSWSDQQPNNLIGRSRSPTKASLNRYRPACDAQGRQKRIMDAEPTSLSSRGSPSPLPPSCLPPKTSLRRLHNS